MTGASGFVGGWLAEALVARGDRVVDLLWEENPNSHSARSGLRQRLESVRGDLRNYDSVDRAIGGCIPDVIVHLAAQTQVGQALQAPLDSFETNIRGTYNLLEAARRAGCASAVIVASSDKAYGNLNGERYTESAPLIGDYPYDVSKSCTDLLSRSYALTFGMPITVIRCGNIYGGGDLNWERLIPGTIRSLFAKERPVIRSDGTLIREYIHISDVVRAYLKIIDSPNLAGWNPFNLGSGQIHDVRSVVDAIGVSMGVSVIPPIIEGHEVQEIPRQTLDWSKAQAQLGWSPMMSFSEGLKEAIAWYSEILP